VNTALNAEQGMARLRRMGADDSLRTRRDDCR